jgi:hypothetical protein
MVFYKNECVLTIDGYKIYLVHNIFTGSKRIYVQNMLAVKIKCGSFKLINRHPIDIGRGRYELIVNTNWYGKHKYRIFRRSYHKNDKKRRPIYIGTDDSSDEEGCRDENNLSDEECYLNTISQYELRKCIPEVTKKQLHKFIKSKAKNEQGSRDTPINETIKVIDENEQGSRDTPINETIKVIDENEQGSRDTPDKRRDSIMDSRLTLSKCIKELSDEDGDEVIKDKGGKGSRDTLWRTS